jgi:branched-chain amino acid transport system substrate-binding protein
VALGGCSARGAGGSAVKVSGKQLTIYLSAPAGSDAVSRDVIAAEQLAFAQKRSEVSGFALALRTLTGTRIADNARTAIEDTHAVAYLGELAPGSSADSLGITNAEQLLQVSPTDTALALTQKASAVSGSPEHYYESLKTYGRTFARVVGTTAAEARAWATELPGLHVRRLYVLGDGSDYSRTLSAELRSAAGPSVSVASGPGGQSALQGANPDAVFLATASRATADAMVTAVLAHLPQVKLLAGSALADPAFAAGLGERVGGGLWVTAPGFTARVQPAGAAQFGRQFTAAYHRQPLPQAVFGYEAMSAVLDVLHQAGGSANDRSTVVRDFFAIRDRSSPLGTYSINAAGDISITPFMIERVRGRLVPVAQLSGSG